MIYSCCLYFELKKGDGMGFDKCYDMFSSKRQCREYLARCVREYVTADDLKKYHVYRVIDIQEEWYTGDPVLFEEVKRLRK